MMRLQKYMGVKTTVTRTPYDMVEVLVDSSYVSSVLTQLKGTPATTIPPLLRQHRAAMLPSVCLLLGAQADGGVPSMAYASGQH